MAPLALAAWAAASAATAAAASNSSLVPRAFDWRRAQLTLDPDCDWSKVGPLTEDVNVACCTRESPCNGQPPRVCPSGGCALAMADLRADPCAPSLEHLLDTAGGGAANGFSEALAVLADQRFASEVRQIENFWVQQGIRGVPAVVLDRKHLVTGAQGVENYTSILGQLAKGAG